MYRSDPARCRPGRRVWLVVDRMGGVPAGRELVRGQVAEARVRAFGVVVEAPGFDDPPRLGERREHVLVQAFITQLAR